MASESSVTPSTESIQNTDNGANDETVRKESNGSVTNGIPTSAAKSAALENMPIQPVEKRQSTTARNGGPNIKAMDSGTGSGNSKIQHLPGKSAAFQPRGSSGNGNSSRSYKEMVEVVKKLHKQADELQERMYKLHCDYAELIVKGAVLFDPKTVDILSDDFSEIGGIADPDKVHFTRQAVSDAYIELSQLMKEQPAEEREF